MLKTTETLLAGLAANDQSRWARFYRDYAPWIESVLVAKGLSPVDAEDIIHETLVDLVRIMPTYTYDPARKGSFHSLIFKIAQNKAVDLRRRNSRERDRLDKFTADPTSEAPCAADATAPFEISEEEWQRATLDMALRRVYADPTIRESSKIAFRRVVQQGEDAAVVGCEIHLAPGVTFITTGRFTPDGALIQSPLPPADADETHHVGYPAFVVENGAKLIFTDNAAYPSALIRTNP